VLTDATLQWLVPVLAVALLLTVVSVVALALRLRMLVRSQRRAFEGGELDVVTALARNARGLSDLRERITEVAAHSDAVREELRGALSRTGVVRYDAFADMGGALSFSVALLDERGDGVVISAINGRSDGRTYIKRVVDGQGTSELSDEERAAIRAALARTSDVITLEGPDAVRRLG
jgi:hypothetical protein